MRIARHAVRAHFANWNRSGWVGRLGPILKPLCWVADNSFVRRSALITGLSLALTGVTIAGIGEWATGRFDNKAPDGETSANLIPSSYTPGRVLIPRAMPDPGHHRPLAGELAGIHFPSSGA